MLAAICGNDREIVTVYSIERRTDTDTVRRFLMKMFRTVRIPSNQLTLVLDNHSAHHSYVLRDYLAYKRVTVLYLPPYSSTLSSVEWLWGLWKLRWAKALAGITAAYDESNLERDMALIMEEVIDKLHPPFLRRNEKYLTKVMSGELA